MKHTKRTLKFFFITFSLESEEGSEDGDSVSRKLPKKREEFKLDQN